MLYPNTSTAMQCALHVQMIDKAMYVACFQTWPLYSDMFPLLLYSITASDYGAGAVDDKDLAVSSNQDNAWLFVHP